MRSFRSVLAAMLIVCMCMAGCVFPAFSSGRNYVHRAVLLDCGRKYFSVGWIKGLIDVLEADGANELVLHFSDSMALRLESKEYPWLAGSDNALSLDSDVPDLDAGRIYSQAEMADIVQYASGHGISVIPEFDSPGHLAYVLQKYEEHDGVRICEPDNPDCLDLNSADGKKFILSLVEEYADFFHSLGCDQISLGGDEVGEAGEYADFVGWMNVLDDTVREIGYTGTRMYSDAAIEDIDAFHSDIEVCYWMLGWRTPAYYQSGHTVINYLNFYLYYVLDPDLVFLGNNVSSLSSQFSPTFFLNWPVDTDKVSGSCFCIWCDIPGYKTEEEVMSDIVPLLAAWSKNH